MLTDKHLLIIVLIIVSIMILLLTIGTAIPQTRPGSFYVEDLEYRPKKNVSKYTVISKLVMSHT